jgi:hypothetical protein
MALRDLSTIIRDMSLIAANSQSQGITLNKLQSIRVDMDELLMLATCQEIGAAI